jgi:hypothetical protein
MRRVPLLVIAWLLVTSCTLGVVQREQVTPATLSPTPPAHATQVTPTPTRLATKGPGSEPTASPTPTVVPTVAPTAVPTLVEGAGSGPSIVYFRANVEEADPGDTIVLEWETVGATHVTLYRIPPSQQLPQSGWDVDTTGSYTYEIPSQDRNSISFQLYASDAAETYAAASLTLPLRCPDEWFFSPPPEICPTAPIISQAAEQHFERGVMIWIGEMNRIYVLYADDVYSPKWEVFIDEWDESQPDRDPELTPPDGLYQPVRGFGLVWRQNPRVRERLGWATDQEMGFETIVQYTTLFKYNSTYIRALDGNVWYLGPERSFWEKLVVE